ncbi:MAG: hypothetical protein WD894_05455 [Pirellulales bacterium]
MYHVERAGTATAALTDFWLESESPERIRINDAVLRIDTLLAASPQEQGESRPGGRRILLAPPLGVIYKVYEPDRRVRVLRVLRFRSHAD